MEYQEGPNSTFTHNGGTWPLDPFLARAAKLPVHPLHVDRVKWALKFSEPDPERVARADVSIPVLYTRDPDYGLVVIDGTHRLARAVQLKLKTLPAREIPRKWFQEIPQVSLESAEVNTHPKPTVFQVTREQALEWLQQYQEYIPVPERQLTGGGYSGPTARVYAFAALGDQILGVASLQNGSRYCPYLYVPVEYRRQGVARTLLDSLLVDLVGVSSDDLESQACLKRVGFESAGGTLSTTLYSRRLVSTTPGAPLFVA